MLALLLTFYFKKKSSKPSTEEYIYCVLRRPNGGYENVKFCRLLLETGPSERRNTEYRVRMLESLASDPKAPGITLRNLFLSLRLISYRKCLTS